MEAFNRIFTMLTYLDPLAEPPLLGRSVISTVSICILSAQPKIVQGAQCFVNWRGIAKIRANILNFSRLSFHQLMTFLRSRCMCALLFCSYWSKTIFLPKKDCRTVGEKGEDHSQFAHWCFPLCLCQAFWSCQKCTCICC